MMYNHKTHKKHEEKYAHIYNSTSVPTSEIGECDLENQLTYGNALLEACRIIESKMNAKIISHINYDIKTLKSDNLLEDIVKTSRVSIQPVSICGNWWNEDNGHLLCFMREDKRPVALIAESEKQYRIYDPLTEKSEIVDENIAKKLSKKAYAFYEPLPDKKLTLKDVFVLGIKSIWQKDFIMVLMISAALAILGTVIPIATGIIFNTVIPEGDTTQIWQIALFLLVGAVAGCIFQLVSSIALIRMEWKIDIAVEIAVWDRLLNLPTTFFKPYTAGELVARMEIVNGIGSKIFSVVASTVVSVLFSLFSFIILFYYDMYLAMVVTLLAIILFGFAVILSKLQQRYQKEFQLGYAKLTGLTNQIIAGIPRLRTAGAENRAFFVWENDYRRMNECEHKIRPLYHYLLSINSIVQYIATILIFYLFTHYRSASMSAGNFIAFASTTISFLTGIIRLSELPSKLNGILIKLEMIKPILNEIPENSCKSKDIGVLNGVIELNCVTFKYSDSDALSLDNITLQICSGERIAVVGASGSGKSTLLKVLLGFEKPQSGSVFYDGNDISKINLVALRKQMGIVFQHGNLIEDNIYRNITGLNCNYSKIDVWSAANMAGVLDDIKNLPRGMRTSIFDGGKTLPHGLRQKLLIARAFARCPRIIMFDEALTFLDEKSRATIHKSIKELNSTGILITHNMDIISQCDRVIVMDKGRIVEQGTFEELKNLKGHFCKLFKL